MSKILNRVSDLPPDKLDSLVQRLSQNERSATSRMLIPRRHADSAPLSFAQTRLWYVDQLKLGSSTYNLHLARRLKGELDISALELSLTEIVRRHETLRTVFMMRDGEPAQVIAPAQSVTLPLIDLSNIDERA